MSDAASPDFIYELSPATLLFLEQIGQIKGPPNHVSFVRDRMWRSEFGRMAATDLKLKSLNDVAVMKKRLHGDPAAIAALDRIQQAIEVTGDDAGNSQRPSP